MFEKLCKGNTFSATGNLIRQTEDCQMCGLILAVLSIFCTEKERDFLSLLIPHLLHKHYVDNTFSESVKDRPKEFFTNLNNHHPDVKFPMDIIPQKFLTDKLRI